MAFSPSPDAAIHLTSFNVPKRNFTFCEMSIFESDHVVRLIADSYVAPNKTLRELHQMMDGDSIDALRAFSEACRAELQKFKLI